MNLVLCWKADPSIQSRMETWEFSVTKDTRAATGSLVPASWWFWSTLVHFRGGNPRCGRPRAINWHSGIARGFKVQVWGRSSFCKADRFLLSEQHWWHFKERCVSFSPSALGLLRFSILSSDFFKGKTFFTIIVYRRLRLLKIWKHASTRAYNNCVAFLSIFIYCLLQGWFLLSILNQATTFTTSFTVWATFKIV